jgi:hypothetical protein
LSRRWAVGRTSSSGKVPPRDGSLIREVLVIYRDAGCKPEYALVVRGAGGASSSR